MPNPFKHFKLHFDRSFSKGFLSQMIWLIVIMLAVYVVLAMISYIGGLYSSDGSSENRFVDILMVLIDPGSGSNSMSNVLIIICALIGLIVFGGMLISVMSNVLERRVESYTNGETNYKLENHVIVLGFNKSIPSLLEVVNRKHPDSFIILMSCNNSESIRDWVHTNVPGAIEDHLVVMNGVRNADDDLRRLCLKNNVREIYVIGEENEEAHDTINMQCVVRLAKMLPIGDVECHVQIDSYNMHSILQSVDFSKTKSDDDDEIGKHLKFLPFNFNEIWSQKVLATIPNDMYKSLDGAGITKDSDKHVHFVIAGMNEMGLSLAINAAHLLHFPNYKEGDFSTCSTITFIDDNAKRLGREFRLRLNNLFDFSRWRSVDAVSCLDKNVGWIDPMHDCEADFKGKHCGNVNFMDIQWEFIEADFCDENVQNYLKTYCSDSSKITTIALCNDDSEKNVANCMCLAESIVKKSLQILVRQKESRVTADLMKKLPWHENVVPFGMMMECYGENLISDKYGKLINACYGDYSSGDKVEVDLKDTAKVDALWQSCKILDKWSSIYSANMIFYKLRSLGLDTSNELSEDDISNAVMANKRCLAELEHNRWDTEKLLLGFRPLTDENELQRWVLEKKSMKSEKIHHDIRAFSVLSEGDKMKDDDVNGRLWELYEMIRKNG